VRIEQVVHILPRARRSREALWQAAGRLKAEYRASLALAQQHAPRDYLPALRSARHDLAAGAAERE